MIQFNAATKKNGYYLSSPKTVVNYNLTNIDFINISALKNNKYVMTAKISQSTDNELLSSMERCVQSTIIENNMVWFSNSLNNDDILERYECNYDEQTQMIDIIIHPNISIRTYGIDNTNDIPNLIHQIVNSDNKDAVYNINIKMVGIYITPQKFSAKWVLTGLDKVLMIDNVDIDYDDLENKVMNFDRKIDKQIKDLNNIRTQMKHNLATGDLDSLAKSFYLILDKT